LSGERPGNRSTYAPIADGSVSIPRSKTYVVTFTLSPNSAAGRSTRTMTSTAFVRARAPGPAPIVNRRNAAVTKTPSRTGDHCLANHYDGRIAVLEKESQVATHTSRRNTGVVHRPFYLDPVERKVFARSSQVAYRMWKAFAAERRLPWLPVGTFEVATRADQLSRLERYRDWGLANGMGEDELALLTAEDVRRLEPNVRCHGAIWSKTDTAVDYQA